MSEYKIQSYDVTEVQEKIFEIYLEFDRICKRHKLTYTLEGGSLLGAVLYQDFIPWDDDMDIIMPRKDYDVFSSIANKELPAPFSFDCMEVNDQYPFLFGKCYNTQTIYKAGNTAHLPIHHGVFLDIFVEDNISRKTLNIHRRLVSAIGTVRYIKLKVVIPRLRHVVYAPLFLLSTRSLTRLANWVMRRYENQNTDYVYPLCESVSSKPPLPRRMITDFQDGIFHGHIVPIPTCHMWYLHKHYETPMEIPPESSRHPTHGVVEIKL